MWKTGHSFIKAKSKEVDAIMGAERSGHMFIRRGYYGYDDALMAALSFSIAASTPAFLAASILLPCSLSSFSGS